MGQLLIFFIEYQHVSRISRYIAPHLPHHVTQRGGRGQNVFFLDSDRYYYLGLLKKNAEKYGVEILAYCLMTNHVHHLVVPADKTGLRWTLQLTHKRYAEFINQRMGWKGHLWQERFYSSPMDNAHFWAALRYVEQNPVEAGLVSHPAEYRWSSAAARCGIRHDYVLSSADRWKNMIRQKKNWYQWLAEAENPMVLEQLKKFTARDFPCGSDSFLTNLESNQGRSAHLPTRGRPKINLEHSHSRL